MALIRYGSEGGEGGEGGVGNEMQAILNHGSYWCESLVAEGGEHLEACAHVLGCKKDSYKVY